MMKPDHPLQVSTALSGLRTEPIAGLSFLDFIQADGGTAANSSSKQRTRIWDLHHSLHCSIIGTCLTTAELRHLLVRLNVQGAGSGDEHAVHQLGVVLANRPQ